MKSKSFSNFDEFVKKNIPPKRLEKAEKAARKEIINYKLAEMRKKYSINQSDFPNFKQSSISRIESQNDIKLSTLIEYLHDMNMELEIKVKPVNKKKSEVLFRG